MSLFQNIQDAICNPQVKLPDILRQCKILAYSLNYKPLKTWVNNELNGYPNVEELPHYRILKDVQIYGNFIGNHYGGFLITENSPIPIYALPEEFRERITTVYLIQNVAGLDKILESAKKSCINFFLPPDILDMFDNVCNGMVCRNAYQVIAVYAIAGIIDTIKTRILDFSLEIKELSPELEDTNSEKVSIPEQDINAIFYNCILQNGGNYTSFHSNITTEQVGFMNNNHGGISQNVSGGQLYGGMQAGQGDYSTQKMETNVVASGEKQLTQEDVIRMLAQIEQLVGATPELPEAAKEKLLKYLGAAKEEAQTKEPDKQLAAGSLKRVAETLKTTSETVASTKNLWENVKPILLELPAWLGVAKSFFGF